MTPLGSHALHLLDGQCRIPHGDQHQRDVAPRRGTAPFLDEPVVVDLKALETELAVAGLHEQLPTEAGQSRKAQRRKHTREIHVLDSRLGVVTPGAHLRVIQWLWAELLLGLADDGTQTPNWAFSYRRTPRRPCRCRRSACAARGPCPWRRRGRSTGWVVRVCDRRPRSSQFRSIAAPSFCAASALVSVILIWPSSPIDMCLTS